MAVVDLAGARTSAADAKLMNGLGSLVANVHLLHARILGLINGYQKREIPAFALFTGITDVWGPVISFAALDLPVRTSEVMEMTETSSVASRGILRRMAAAGWLETHGRTRGMFYTGTDLIRSLNLRAPELVQRYVRAETLGL